MQMNIHLLPTYTNSCHSLVGAVLSKYQAIAGCSALVGPKCFDFSQLPYSIEVHRTDNAFFFLATMSHYVSPT